MGVTYIIFAAIISYGVSHFPAQICIKVVVGLLALDGHRASDVRRSTLLPRY